MAKLTTCPTKKKSAARLRGGCDIVSKTTPIALRGVAWLAYELWALSEIILLRVISTITMYLRANKAISLAINYVLYLRACFISFFYFSVDTGKRACGELLHSINIVCAEQHGGLGIKAYLP